MSYLQVVTGTHCANAEAAVRDANHVRGCLIGGAAGDALGAPVEFMTLSAIRARFGPEGIGDFVASTYGKPGLITDDTQMTLFTAEGLLRAKSRAMTRVATDDASDDAGAVAPSAPVVHRAYLRWLTTQDGGARVAGIRDVAPGWLVAVHELHARRAPGNTCLSALQSGRTVYCALVAEGDFERGVRLAVNHGGDSDSTGAIAGNGRPLSAELSRKTLGCRSVRYGAWRPLPGARRPQCRGASRLPACSG